jgi:hypothetical protein
VASGGKGGTVNLDSSNGAVTVSSSIQVSSDGLTGPAKRVSKQGGNISLHSGMTSGKGINVTSSGQLLSLLNSTLPGPGGTIQVISEGADINVSGKIQADKGTIDVHNNGANGNVLINSTAQLAADVIKVGALGSNGLLTVQAGSQINAGSMLKLYAGDSVAGKVLFTGNGDVVLNGNEIHIAAKTVQIDANTKVQNNGPTSVHTDNASFGVGAGGGKFQNPLAPGSGAYSTRPSFN